MEAEIRALLQEHGVGFKTNSKSFIMTCPRCSKAQKLYIRRRDGRFVCWSCNDSGFHGRADYALAELCNLSLEEVQKALYGEGAGKPTDIFLSIDINDFEDEESDDFIDVAPTLPEVAWPLDYYPLDHDYSIKGIRYLEARGVPAEIAWQYGVRYCPSKVSLVFPVQQGGKLYGWQTRLVEGDKPYWSKKWGKMVSPVKAFTMTGLEKEKIVMFADRLNGSTHCVLAEGPFDALKAHLCGGNVASLGKGVSSAQLQLIRNAGIRHLYLGLDPDAYLEIDRIRKECADMVLYDLRAPAPYKDLGAMSMIAVKECFDRAPILNPAQVVIYLKNHFGA